MKEIQIDFVENGAEYDDVIWDFWVIATLKDGLKIKLFDYQGLDLRHLEGCRIKANIKALFIQTKKNTQLLFFKGIVSHDNKGYIFKSDNIDIVVNELDIIVQKIPLNTKDAFYFGRLDLKDFELITEV